MPIEIKKLAFVVTELIINFPLEPLNEPFCTGRAAGDDDIAHHRRLVIGAEALNDLLDDLVDAGEALRPEELIRNGERLFGQNEVSLVG